MREDAGFALMSTEVPVLLKPIGDHVVWTSVREKKTPERLYMFEKWGCYDGSLKPYV